MKLERVFEDLGDFVAAYRGAISREGMLHVADSHWPLGTTLKVDLRLQDGLALVRGLATVVRIQLAPEGGAGWLVALKFLDLDPASRDLLDRLEKRNEGEGVPPFRLANPEVRPPATTTKPVHRTTPPPRPAPMSFDFTPAPPGAGVAPEPPEEPGDEFAPEHEPHPALRGSVEPEAEPTPPPERTVPLGLAAEPTPGPAFGTARRPLRGSEATLPMAPEEPPAELVSDLQEGVAEGLDRDRPSSSRWLLWAAALAAVAVIAVTLTWLLVPELFSGRTTAGSAPPATVLASGAGPDAAADGGGPAEAPPAQPGSAPADLPAATPTSGTEAAATEVPAAPPTATAAAVPTAAPTPRPAAAPAAATVDEPLRVLATTWTEDADGTTVVITGSRPFDPGRLRTGRLEDGPGPRELVRLLDVASSSLAVQTSVGGRDLGAIRTWLHDNRRPPELHVVLDLADRSVVAAPPEVTGTTVVIRLGRGGR